MYLCRVYVFILYESLYMCVYHVNLCVMGKDDKVRVVCQLVLLQLYVRNRVEAYPISIFR